MRSKTLLKSERWTEKFLGVIGAINARAVRGDAKAKHINIHRLIAVQLEKQLESLDDPSSQNQFVKNLKQFLQTLQADSDDANTIIWSGNRHDHESD